MDAFLVNCTTDNDKYNNVDEKLATFQQFTCSGYNHIMLSVEVSFSRICYFSCSLRFVFKNSVREFTVHRMLMFFQFFILKIMHAVLHAIQNAKETCTRDQDPFNYLKNVWLCIISNTRDRVLQHCEKPRRENCRPTCTCR